VAFSYVNFFYVLFQEHPSASGYVYLKVRNVHDHVNQWNLPALPDSEIQSIRLQARPEGYRIDDLVLTLRTKQHKINDYSVRSKTT
jgi:hypothetical protein